MIPKEERCSWKYQIGFPEKGFSKNRLHTIRIGPTSENGIITEWHYEGTDMDDFVNKYCTSMIWRTRGTAPKYQPGLNLLKECPNLGSIQGQIQSYDATSGVYRILYENSRVEQYKEGAEMDTFFTGIQIGEEAVCVLE